jgi:glycosyltransferase involved in cell wall biosynthesis
MEILFASRCFPSPPHYGDRLILYHLLQELRARGHACDVVAFHQSAADLGERDRSAALCRELEPVVEQPRSVIRYLTRLGRPFPDRAELCWNPAMWRALARRLAARRYDVVHLFGGIQVYEVRDLVRRVPTVIVPYESHALWMERAVSAATSVKERLVRRLKLAVVRRYERVMYVGFDRVVVLTNADRDAIARLAPDLPIVVIPNGVEPRPAGAAGTAVEPILLFVGNFEYEPNVDAAVTLVTRILPLVRSRVPNARVQLVGTSPPPALRKLAAPDVEVTGWVADIGPLLAGAGCMVAPLTQGAGMKNKVLEAMAAGVPVATTPIGCDGLAAADGEHLVCRADVPSLADGVVRILTDPRLRARLGEAGRRYVREHHSWTDVAARYESLYRTMIAARGTA